MSRKRAQELKRILLQIDGKGYNNYRKLQGEYEFPDYDLDLFHVQADPFAPPSKISIRVPIEKTGIPHRLFANKSREIALRDFLARSIRQAIQRIARLHRGSGKSGLIDICKVGQEILDRDCVVFVDGCIEVILLVGLPAYGRSIKAHEAKEMFYQELPAIIRQGLFYENLNKSAVEKHVTVAEDADWLRSMLRSAGLVAFVADGSILPRVSRIEPRPKAGSNVVPFKSPDSLRRHFELPNHGPISGMGIPAGVTLIVGGGYHGKSTLLEALQLGVYNHIPGDGREFVVSLPSTVKIRAESGRFVSSVDLSPFINELPGGVQTNEFTTENASGTTSQAASIIEALEIGAEVLLLDEDSSAMNFLIRDHRMQKLLPKQLEPINPFIDRVRALYDEYKVSTILVTGGSGEYFDVADLVIGMIEYQAQDLTEKAKEISRQCMSERRQEVVSPLGPIRQRIPIRESIDPSKGRRTVKINVPSTDTILFGRVLIDLAAVEQIVEQAQTRAIGEAIYYSLRYIDGVRPLSEVIKLVMDDIQQFGVSRLSARHRGEMALFRAFEMAAALNRLRSIRMRLVRSEA